MGASKASVLYIYIDNIYYEFSDFCFCVSCYSFIYLLKLNIVYYCTTLDVSLLICNSYII